MLPVIKAYFRDFRSEMTFARCFWMDLGVKWHAGGSISHFAKCEMMGIYSFVPSMNLELQALIEGEDDDNFDSIYPSHIRRLAKKHWTPISVAKTAALFLAHRRGIQVLDIGSGVGKFCMVGAALTRGHFTGVEQRQELVDLSQTLSAYYDLDNTTYINANIISIDFSEFKGFYLYNSFFENLDKRNGIDKKIALSEKLYESYGSHVSEKLSSLPSGVRLATYYTDDWIVPTNFELVYNLFKGNLKLWEKVN